MVVGMLPSLSVNETPLVDQNFGAGQHDVLVYADRHLAVAACGFCGWTFRSVFHVALLGMAQAHSLRGCTL